MSSSDQTEIRCPYCGEATDVHLENNGEVDDMVEAGGLTVGATLLTGVLFQRTGRMRAGRGAFNGCALLAVLTNRASLPNLLVAPLTFSAYFLVQATIGKKLLTDYCGMSSAAAAAFTFVMMLVTMGAATVGGFATRWSDNRRKPVIVASIAAAVLASAMLLAALHGDWPPAWFLAAYLILAAANVSAPAATALIRELNPPALTGTAVGVLNAVVYLGVALVTTVAGFIMDGYADRAVQTESAVLYPREAYTTIFRVCLGMSLTALAISMRFIRESHGRSLWPSGAEDLP